MLFLTKEAPSKKTCKCRLQRSSDALFDFKLCIYRDNQYGYISDCSDRRSLVCVYIVCQHSYLKISTDDFNVIGILRVNILLECVYICIFSFNHEQKY